MKHVRNSDTPRASRKWRRMILTATAIILGIGLLGLVTLAVLPALSPTAGAAVADQLRAWVGPEPVAELESLSFQFQDALNQIRYRTGNEQPQLSWATTGGVTETPDAASPVEPPAVDAPLTPTPAPTAVPDPTATPQADALQMSRHGGVNMPALATATPTIPSGFGWQPFGPTPAGQFVLARTVLQPDPLRPYAQAAVVRIDLANTSLHLAPGSVEPIAARGVAPFPRPGMIPLDQQTSGNLVAAFNGGFKAVNGAYGMFSNGITILPPQNGIATVALYRDGSVQMGAWGSELKGSPDLIALRQNCPLLVDDGVINPQVQIENPQLWGYTVKNLDTTWRSGLGLTADGRYLIYAAGPSLTVQALATALQHAGAYYAMQLDINAPYTRFVTFWNIAPNHLVADKLLSQMVGTPSQFLTPYDRDFFYLTAITAPGR
ncbi:MAG: phosphodiester glycosidase family protein [Anaerolineae bacterium]